MMLSLILAAAVPPAVPHLAAPPIAQAAAPADLKAIAAIDRLLAQGGFDTGYDAMTGQMIDATLPAFVRNNPGQGERVRTILREEFVGIIAELKPAMKAKSRALYLQSFSATELEEMVRLSQTPLGIKMRAVLPGIQQQMFAFGQQAGRAAFAGASPRIAARLRAAKLNVPARI